MPVLLIFIDGLGIGRRDAGINPLADSAGDLAPLAFFQNENEPVYRDGILIPTDPRLGVEGRPQSASGQTTILTGFNAPHFLGYHKQGFPNAAMREIIAERSIFLQLENLGIEPNAFANAYTPQFFEEEPRWKSATTCAVEASTVRFKTLDDLKRGEAVFHDFTNRVLQERGFDFPLETPENAARNLVRLARKNRFTLYEHFLTDKIGHAQDFGAARTLLPELAKFVRTVLNEIDLSETAVLLTSDHGNIEDLSIKNHTLNDVPTIAWGREKEFCAARIRSLANITPTIVEILKNERNS
ncbi:MAG: peptidase [Acidobacteriota bacterium]|nr:peptidase [Acidobacteriota bacterium]